MGGSGAPCQRATDQVKIEFDLDGLIVLNAHDGKTDAHLCKLEVHRPGNLSKTQRAAAAMALARTEVR